MLEMMQDSSKDNQSMDNEDQLLVTVRVSTYKSSKTVIDTLESIKTQTYKNIELIITDDCSPDNTVDICKKWLEENGDRFTRVEVVTSEKNTGVSGNINRGTAHSHGKWLKGIAGDDLLIPTAIEEFMRFVSSKPNIKICVSDVECFSEEGKVPQDIIDCYSSYFKMEQETYEQQWNRICHEIIFVGPAYFVSRELFDEIGGYTTEYANGEEWPFIYKILKKGYRIYAVDKKLVKYRISSKSLSRQVDDNGLGNKALFQSTYNFFFDYPFHDLIREHRYFAAAHYSLYYMTLKLCYITNNAWYAKILNRYYFYFSPYVYLRKARLVK